MGKESSRGRKEARPSQLISTYMHDTPENNVHQKAKELRAILGPEPSESTIYSLIEHNGSVHAAVNAHFGGAPSPATAAPAAAAQDLVRVLVPEGCQGGSPLRVQTDRGLMQVNVPAGLSPGNEFLLRIPRPREQPAGHIPNYPGAAMAPTVSVYHVAPPPIIVHSHPYAHPYRGYYDPIFPGAAVGMLGGLLIADALFW